MKNIKKKKIVATFDKSDTCYRCGVIKLTSEANGGCKYFGKHWPKHFFKGTIKV